MDRGAWRAIVPGVAESQTWLKRLSTDTAHPRPIQRRFVMLGRWNVRHLPIHQGRGRWRLWFSALLDFFSGRGRAMAGVRGRALRGSAARATERATKDTIELGTSLVVQWLNIHLPGQEMWVRSLVRELRSHIPRGNWAHVPQLERSQYASMKDPDAAK